MAGLLIFDFDGTLTDAEQEGVPYQRGYLEDVAALCGQEADVVIDLAKDMEAKVQEDVGSFGWKFGGQIVAPACVDPYLRMMPVARMIFDHFGCFKNSDDRDRILDRILYKYNYPKTKIVFREGAAELLTKVNRQTTYVVTNSHTKPVQEKIKMLSQQTTPAGDLDWLVERVYGNAKKYILDGDFDAVPEALTLAGLDRPVLLRRAHYYSVLDALRAKHDLKWSDVTVVGDIFELDLCLPFSLGATVCLMQNPFSPKHELDFLKGQARGHVVTNLEQVAQVLSI